MVLQRLAEKRLTISASYILSHSSIGARGVKDALLSTSPFPLHDVDTRTMLQGVFWPTSKGRPDADSTVLWRDDAKRSEVGWGRILKFIS